MLYDQQLGLLLLLQRICEHFAASALSLDHTKSLDGVRMVVPACIAAVADAVMRQLAIDKPSRVCVHLRGGDTPSAAGGAAGKSKRTGFAISSAALMTQSTTIPVHTPELNTARTCAIDYFAGQEALPKVFQWESSEMLDKPTARFLQLIAHDLAFPTDLTNTAQYNWDVGALLIKNFPEFRCYRDIAFYFKFFLNPDVSRFRSPFLPPLPSPYAPADTLSSNLSQTHLPHLPASRSFPPKRQWTQRQAELTFVYQKPLL